MNLLYTSTAYPPSTGGAQMLHHMTAQSLQGRHEIQIFSHWEENRTDWLLGTTISAPKSEHDYVIDGINVHRLGLTIKEKATLLPWLPLYYPLMSVALPRIASCVYSRILPYARNADLIHNMRIGREGISYASLKAARDRNIPFVLTPVHHPRWIGWRYKAYNDIYRQADAVIALTPTEKNTLMQLGVSEEKIHVTGTGPVVAPTAFPDSFLSKNSIASPFVLFLGQHYNYKGYRQVLESAKLVWKKFPDTNFVFIGPTVKESENTFKLFQDPRIKRLGKVSLQDKTDALAACTLLCVPSMQESFGSVYTESWQFEKPVIGGNIPAISDVIQDGVDGYLVEQDADVIATRIIHLLNHPTQAHAMGKAGKLKVDSQYNWERLASIIEQVYLSLV